MVVVGGLVGAGALGYDVVAGFSQSRLYGKGLAAGIAIVLLGDPARPRHPGGRRPHRHGATHRREARPRRRTARGTDRAALAADATERLDPCHCAPRSRRARRRSPRGPARDGAGRRPWPAAAARRSTRPPPARTRAAPAGSGTACGTVDLAISPWVGYEANAAVIQVIAEERARLHGRQEGPQGGDRLAGLRHRRGRRRRRELGPRGPQGQARPRGRRHRRRRRADRRQGRHRLVRAGRGWPRSTRTSPTGRTSTSTRRCSRPRESGGKGQLLDGDPSLRHQRRGAGQEPRPRLRGGLRRQRGRAHHRVPPGASRRRSRCWATSTTRSGSERGAAGQGRPARLHRGLRRRRREGRLRLPGLRARQGDQQAVRGVRQPRRRADRELHLDQRASRTRSPATSPRAA